MGLPGRARGHDLVALARAAEEESGLVLHDATTPRLTRLSRDYQPTRYPDALRGGTPAEHYRPADADAALHLVDAVMQAVDDRWRELLAAADER